MGAYNKESLMFDLVYTHYLIQSVHKLEKEKEITEDLLFAVVSFSILVTQGHYVFLLARQMKSCQ